MRLLRIRQTLVCGAIALAIAAAVHVCRAQDSRTDPRLDRILKRFPEADANGDGILTAAEARAYLEKMRQSKPGPAAPQPAETAEPIGPFTLTFDKPAPAEMRIRPLMTFGMEGLFKLHQIDAKTAAKDPYVAMVNALGANRLEYIGGSTNAWSHLGPDPGEKQKPMTNPPATCPACPASQRRGYYVWQSDVNKVNAITAARIAEGHEKPHNYPYSLANIAGLAHGPEVFTHDFWDDYKALMSNVAPQTRSSLVFNVLNGTLDEARRQLDELIRIRPVADVSLGVEQAIGGYMWKYDTKGWRESGREYARVVEPFMKVVQSYREAHPEPQYQLGVFAAVPPIERYRPSVTCNNANPANELPARAACWQEAVNALPVDGIMQYSWAMIGGPQTAASDGPITEAMFKFTDQDVKGKWDFYRKAFPHKRMIVGQWGLHPVVTTSERGMRPGASVRGTRALGEALFVPLFMFAAVSYDLDAQHPEQHGFLECLRFYQLKNLTVQESTNPIPSYHAFVMLKPAFRGNARVAWQGACPGSNRCRLVLVEGTDDNGTPQSTLYAINFRPGAISLKLTGPRGPGKMPVRIESITGPNLLADYVSANNRAVHSLTTGTADVILAPRSFTAISWRN